MSISDFMTSQAEETDPYRIASEAVLYFCTDEGGFNGLRAAVLISPLFLEYLTGISCHDKQLMADLKAYFDAGNFEIVEKYFRDFFQG